MKTATRKGRELKDYLQLMAAMPAPESVEVEALLQGVRAGESAALRKLAEVWLPQVVAWVAPRRGEAASFQELIAIGNCALIETLKGYSGSVGRLEETLFEAVHDALDHALKLGA